MIAALGAHIDCGNISSASENFFAADSPSPELSFSNPSLSHLSFED